jgi:hypothetical protein
MAIGALNDKENHRPVAAAFEAHQFAQMLGGAFADCVGKSGGAID